jgi:hypothetical protein
MTSPPATVPSALHVIPATEFFTKRTLPSPNSTFTPPGWYLRAVIAAKVGPPFSSRMAIKPVSRTATPPNVPGVCLFGGQANVEPAWLVLRSYSARRVPLAGAVKSRQHRPRPALFERRLSKGPKLPICAMPARFAFTRSRPRSDRRNTTARQPSTTGRSCRLP